MAGGVSSLNVSAAGAVVLYEAFRQRRNAAHASPGGGFPSKAQSAKVAKKQKGLGS
jgi:23S rRNA (guanosine2251-2'-O)-methyltransferase